MSLDAEARAHLTHRPTNTGLSGPWKWDPKERGFSHKRYFGQARPKELPRQGLGRVRRTVENQLYTLRCGPYSSAVSQGYLRNIRFHPDYQAKLIGKKQGRNVDENGSEPRAIMNAMRDDGALPWDRSNIHLETHGSGVSGNWSSYPNDLDGLASKFRITGYLGVDDQYDTFDDIRWALFNAHHKASGTGAVVHAFSQWYAEWDKKIIPEKYSAAIGWHTYLFIDWIELDGELYLVAQNSYGTEYGDGGFHLFPREVVNREFAKWGTALKIPTGILTDEMIANAKRLDIIGYIQRAILLAWYRLSEKFGRYA